MTTKFMDRVSDYYNNKVPDNIRALIERSEESGIASDSYPYDKKLDKSIYKSLHENLQIELAKVQAWARETGQRIAIVFEGRDAAGKGGVIKRFGQNLNPRYARVVALSKPSDIEQTQWYFQRYISHLPSAGEIIFFDRSWYNRAVVEKVFGFCSDDERESFFEQVPQFETMLRNDGIILIKLWLNVGRAEQLKRFLAREQDILKHWKLSPIDVNGLEKWDEYSAAIKEMFQRTHMQSSPWHVIRSDDKLRARLAAMQMVLQQLDYPNKSIADIGLVDTKIAGGPERLTD